MEATEQTGFQEEYICTDCGFKQMIKSTQPILCTQCHCRIFRKLRTKHIVQYVAR